MRKTIRTILYIWFAISFTYLFITGSVLNWENYLVHLTQNIPNFNELFNDLINSVHDLYTIWQTDASVWQQIYYTIANLAYMLWQITILPVKALYYLYKVIVAFLPYMN